jgi:hypothetical protein
MPGAVIDLPEDVADRLREVSRVVGLPPRQAASMLLALVLGRTSQPPRDEEQEAQ